MRTAPLPSFRAALLCSWPAWVVLLSGGASGCREPSAPPLPRPAALPAPGTPTMPADRAPLSQRELPTTDGTIATGNLDAQIEGLTRRRSLAPGDVEAGVTLVELLLQRGQLLGRIADTERATREAERLAREQPRDPRTLLGRARVRAALHRFVEAERDLRAAAAVRGDRAQLAELRATLLEARGREDEALALRQQARRDPPSLRDLGLEAALRAARGELREAERLFVAAQHRHRDVSPLPIAWLYFQHGLAEERAGRRQSARELYAAARERLPAHAQATAHLAALETDPERAIALLRPLVAASDDPEHAGQLARWLRAGGHTEEAAAVRAAAARRYDELLERHPAAFADHAARFWLGPGGDPLRSLELARRAARARAGASSAQLILEAAVAAGATKEACHEADRALARIERPGAGLLLAAARAYAACGRGEGERAALEAANR